MGLTLRYFTVGKPALQHITAFTRIDLIDQKSASITHIVVKFACKLNAIISVLLTLILSFKFRFTFLVFDAWLPVAIKNVVVEFIVFCSTRVMSHAVKKSSRSLSHLLMSFLSCICAC